MRSKAVSRCAAIAEFVLYSTSDGVRLCLFDGERRGLGMSGSALPEKLREIGEDEGRLREIHSEALAVLWRPRLGGEGGASRLGRGRTVGKNKSSSMTSSRPPTLRMRRTSDRTNFQRLIGMHRVRLAIRMKSKELSGNGKGHFTLADS